ncbi:MAG: prolyl oligopeptidase family serine peptidase [Longimicrobiales bacterium]|nr:prolyl oligopeptidase family serine peptidase [Longimicrobiales bacterium]
MIRRIASRTVAIAGARPPRESGWPLPLEPISAWMTLLLVWPAAASAQPYTVDDWMTVSDVDEYVWAPDGSAVYFTSNAAPSGTYAIYRVDPDGGEPTLLTRTPGGVRPEPVEQLTVSPDGETLFFTMAPYFQAYTNIYRMPVTGGVPQALTFHDARIQTDPSPAPDGRTLAFWERTGRGTKIHLMDLEEPSWTRLLLDDDGEDRAPRWAADGTLAFSRGGRIWIMDRVGAEPRPLVRDDFAGAAGGGVWSPDGSRMAVTNGTSGYAQIGVVDVATGTVSPLTYERNEHGSPSWSPDSEWVVYLRNDDVGMSNDVVLVRADGTGEPRILTRGKGIRSSPGFSPDGSRISFLESNSVRTTDMWTVRPDGSGLRQVTRSMGRIDPGHLRPAQEFAYLASDNIEIPGMMWLPPGFDPDESYPVLVRLHGHPGQWNHSFRLLTQYFVSQGFVAVAPNPRGSRGFGAGFHDLHIGDYGGVELDDVMRVIPWLESLGYVDMSRKATWGGSGGGYLSLVIATEEPEAFEAQVIRAPVSDWELLAIDRYAARGRAWTANRTPRRERSEFGGPASEIPEEYRMRSPINFVDRVTVPQLLIHGLRDGSVPPRQSQVWAERMEALGKGHLLHYVELPDEDHGLRRYKSTRRTRIELMESFLAEHLDLPWLPEG